MVSDHLLYTDIIHQGKHSRISKAVVERDQEPPYNVIVKQISSDDRSKNAQLRLSHEFSILSQLKIDAVCSPMELRQTDHGNIILFPAINAISLRRWLTLQRPDFNQRLDAALNIAKAVGQIHEAGIIHKQISPDNILITPDTLQIRIIDFALSSRLQREHPIAITAPNSKQDLTYIAPEQTGRINRVIDYRSDYYGLGVTLYELFTGNPPFESEESLELIHCHLARQPVEPYILNTDLPEPLSQIIMKLLAKDAGMRYQSSFGLRNDLQNCIALQHTQKNESFQVGAQDISERFELPQKLYGRDTTINALKHCFDSASQGEQSLILLSGYAGIGKSSLAHEIRHYITQQHGFFAAGKFDQYHRNRPYTAIYQALQTLIRQLLTESDDQIRYWREHLLTATGDNAQVLFHLIPELELILGKQPVAPKLSPSEEQHRFSHIIRQILKVFATEAHPLVLFFDDLHWADLSSLKLLDKLSHNPQHPYLLIIGSYRSHSFSANHPFSLAIEHLKKAPVNIQEFEITPLKLDEINQLITDTLGHSKDRCLALAEVCFEKTQGNPFFLNQFLQDLYDKGLINFQENCWNWNTLEIRNCEITDDVIEFMVDKLQQLSEDTQEVLRIAACIGNPIPLHILARVCQQTPTETSEKLWQALTEGLIHPIGASQQYSPETHSEKILFRFVHDRVQQAAYSLIEQKDLESLHHQIGMVLKESLPVTELGRKLFDVTNHLNQSLSLVQTDQEKIELAELNLKTGIRARESAAFESAFDYFHQGLTLLEAQPSVPQALLVELQRNAAETAYIKADFDYLDQLLDTAIPQASSLRKRVQLEELRIEALVAKNHFSEALEVAVNLLNLLKIPLPLSPSNTTINLSRLRVNFLLSRYSDERILSLPKITDPSKLAAMSLLANMFGVVKFSSSGLRPLVMAKEVELTLRYGLSDESSMAFAGYGGVLCGKYQQIELGTRLGQLAIKLTQQFSNNREHKAQYLYNAYIRHYRDHLRQCADSLFDSHMKALETGDIAWSAYSLSAFIQYEFVLCNNLGELSKQIKQYSLQIQESGQKQSLHYTLMTQQTVEALLSPHPAGLDGIYYDATSMLHEYQTNNHKTAICLHYYYKGLLALIHQDYATAEEHFEQASEFSPYILGTYTAPYLDFFSTLNSLILIESTSVLEQSHRLKKAKRYLKSVDKLCKHSQENHRHHYLLVKAMMLMVEGRYSHAIDFFDHAVQHAKEYNFTLDHAIALEQTSHCYRQWKKDTLFQHYMTQAYKSYAEWGASSKKRLLEKTYHFLNYTQTHPLETEVSVVPHTEESEFYLSDRVYDITSVIKASQAISDEIMLEPLISTLIKLAIVNAGAQRAVLLLNHETLTISAEAMIEEETRFFDELPLNQAAEFLPTSIIHYVARTKENVVLGDARKHEMFQQDPYIQEIQPRSLLALPILYHGELTAILYLENNRNSDVFDRNRLETLQILAAQAAISIENAKLYQSLEQSEYDFKSLFLNAVEGIFRASPNGQFISANPALATLLGFRNMDEFHKEITDIASQCFYDDLERDLFLSKLDSDHKVINFETRWRKNSGEPIYLSLSARKVLDPNGQVQYYEGSLTDISERKAKEVAEQARYEAEAENEAKSMFLATMSHEIRTPMNGILGMAQLMKKGSLNQEQQEQVNTIYNAGQSLLAILNNILDYSKVESGQLELENKSFLIQQVMDDTYNLFLPVAQEKALQIVPNIDRNLPPLTGDPRVLNQILMNLCSNALKFTHQGFITLSVQKLGIEHNQVRLRFTIEDTGIGIPTSARSKIFQHFTQADSSITRRYGGTGLGLAITKQIIEHLGGEIGFESVENQGTTFWFELNYDIATRVPEVVAPTNAFKPEQCLDILLVEDTPINQQVTQGLLESDGHNVSIADDGFTALSMHNDHAYDLILMDIHLPDMDGMETTRRIRQHPNQQRAEVRIIALTASVTPTEIDSYLAAGMDGVLAKPIQDSDLQAIIHQHSPRPVQLTTEQETMLDHDLLKQHREMLGEESLKELLAQFDQQVEQLFTDMTVLLNECHSTELSQKAHTLSGAAANFGFAAVQKGAKQIEHLTQPTDAVDFELISQLLSELKKTYLHSQAQLSG
ncbi:AAA family ATPase [uncultured Neptuniibacter sp.]|uniref:AAA family ATPase n=1 Tax=uncultured Neptuniibacter sp. TaxID=502143 RepID=UPI00260E33D4|nr:AAA family ATPase [uncultured Neptuniibacter sp.]